MKAQRSPYDDNPCKPRHFRPPPCAPVALDEPAQQTLEVGRTRLLVTAALFVVAFSVIALRLVDVTMVKPTGDTRLAHSRVVGKAETSRADIVDRNGILLATTLASPSLFANPKQILDAGEATRKLLSVLPDLSEAEVFAKLTSDRSFVWLKRHLTPRQQFEINRLGVPGFQFEREERRVYPDGNLISHVVGYSGIDNKGLAGIERGFDDILKERKEPLQLSIDIRLQHTGLHRHRRRRHRHGCAQRRGAGADFAARLRSQQVEHGDARDDLQPGDSRHLRDGLDLQDIHHGDGARRPHDDPGRRLRCEPSDHDRPLHHP